LLTCPCKRTQTRTWFILSSERVGRQLSCKGAKSPMLCSANWMVSSLLLLVMVEITCTTILIHIRFMPAVHVATFREFFLLLTRFVSRDAIGMNETRYVHSLRDTKRVRAIKNILKSCYVDGDHKQPHSNVRGMCMLDQVICM
jgi:hypothetical protein